MVIKCFKVSLPYDFLEHLIVTKTENKDRNFTAVFAPAGESIDGVLSNCTVKAKTSNLNVELSFKSTHDYFDTRDNYLNCTVYKWKVCDEKSKSGVAVKIKEMGSSEYLEKIMHIPSKHEVSEIALKHDYSSASRKRIALKDDISEQSDNPKKQKASHESQNIASVVKSRKTTGSLLTKYKAKSTNSNGTEERTVSCESQRKNLCPRNTKIDWSAGDSCDEDDFGDDDDNDGTYHPSEDDDDDVSGPSKGHQSSTILRCLGIVPGTEQVQPNHRQQDVKNPDIKTSEETAEKNIPAEPHPATSKGPDDGIKKTKRYVLNLNITFPLQEVPGVLHVCGESQGRGEPMRMSLVSTDATTSDFPTNILFLSDLSKGPIASPHYFPKKFQVFSIKEGMSVLIGIFYQRNDCSKTVVTKKHKKVTLNKKLLELQEKGQLIEFSAHPSEPKEPPTIDNLFGTLNTTSKRVVIKDSNYTMENKPAKLSTSEQLPSTHNKESSDHSEAEYTDEMQFVQAPALIVTTVQAGNIIPVLNYTLTSSNVLKTKEDRYYVQGKLKDVNGLVLLGPFSMNYQPHPFLNFIPIDEPEVQHNISQQRWPRKHDKEIFSRPSGGVLADEAAVFVDHDYFSADLASQTHFSSHAISTAGDEMEETPSTYSEGLILVSTHGLDDDTPHIPNNRDDDVYSHHGETENQIPVVASLEEAMHPGRLGMPVPERTDFGEAQEEVKVDTRDLPMVMSEVTVYTSGIQTDTELVEKNMQKKDEGQIEDHNPFVENDTIFKIEKKYICKFCLKVMGDNVRLADHVRLCHKNCPGYIQYAQEMNPQKVNPQKVNLQMVKVYNYCDTKRSFLSSDKLPPSITKKVPQICTICKKLFASPTILLKHITMVHENVQYQCHLCAYAFKNPELLQSHSKGQHKNIREHACSQCSGTFLTAEYLRKHVEKVHKVRDKVALTSSGGADGEPSAQKPPTPWNTTSTTTSIKQCFMCRYSFDPRNMKMHLRQIHGIELKDYVDTNNECKTRKCVPCSLEFSSRSEIEFHRFHFHDYNYKFNCPYCGHAAFNKKALNDHILSAHFSLGVHECFLCGVDCEKAGILSEHMKQKHPGRRMDDDMRKFICIHCTESFNTRYLLMQHLVSPAHFSFFTHTCSKCQQRFQRLCDLEHHLKIIHNTESQFEIISQSSNDKIVYMVVQKEVSQLGDLPRKAQLALARLQREGKQVMIITKHEEETDEMKSRSDDTETDAIFCCESKPPKKTSTPTQPLAQTVKTSISPKKLQISQICKPYQQQSASTAPNVLQQTNLEPQRVFAKTSPSLQKIALLPTSKKTAQYVARPPNMSTSSSRQAQPANVASNSPFATPTVQVKPPTKTGQLRPAYRTVRILQHVRR